MIFALVRAIALRIGVGFEDIGVGNRLFDKAIFYRCAARTNLEAIAKNDHQGYVDADEKQFVRHLPQY